MPLSDGGGKGNGRPPFNPDLRDKLKQVLPGGTGTPRALWLPIIVAIAAITVSYTHLTLPTNREV